MAMSVLEDSARAGQPGAASHSSVAVPVSEELTVDDRTAVQKISDEVWGNIFESVDHQEAINTLSLVDRHWMYLSRCILLSMLHITETALMELQFLYTEATVEKHQLMLPLSAV